MGQKVHPHGARVGVIKNWDARWFADKKGFSDNLIADYELRKLLKKKLYNAKISKIEIERTVGRITVNIFAANPGIIIGRGGQSIEATKKEISEFVNKNRENHLNVTLNIREIKNPDMDAQLVAESIAQQLEKRISFRRAMKMAMGRAMKSGAKGIKTKVGGRLGGAEIARREGYHEGSIPLQTLRADIDYGFAEAHTVSGRLGVKVWIYKGQILPKPKKKSEKAEGTVN